MTPHVHPAAIIEDGVELGSECQVHAGAILRRGTRLGRGVTVHPYAVLAGDPQDLRFDPATTTGVEVGDGCVLREYVTLNRATKPETFTRLGEKCFLMAGAHLAHDVQLGRGVILANNVLLAGHVQVGDGAFLGGGAAVHQFCRIGEGAMVGGLSRITLDVAPFTLVAERDEVSGLNLVGLRRRNLPRDTIRELKELYRKVYFEGGNIRLVAQQIQASEPPVSPEALRFLTFFLTGKRGFARPDRPLEASGVDTANE